MNETIRIAYERWADGDHDGFLRAFATDAVFLVPGQTRISGDHDKSSFRQVLTELDRAQAEGRHRQDQICSYEGENGSVVLFDTMTVLDGAALKYHSAHEWVLRDGVPFVWMLYIHEFDLFQRAWS